MANLPTQAPDRKSNAQVIMDWFEGRISDDELTDTNREYLDRVKTCYRSQMNFDAKNKTIKKLMKQHKVSRATGHRIYNETEMIYGSSQQFNKNYMRHQAIEMAKTAFRKAKFLESPKLMVAATNAYIRATGIELESADIPAFRDLDPGDVITMLPEIIGKAIIKDLQGGAVNLNDNAVTIDVTHEEVPGGN